MYTAPNWTVPIRNRRIREAVGILVIRRNGRNTASEIASLTAAIAVGSMPASRLMRPNEKAQTTETARSRSIVERPALDPEDGPQPLSEEHADPGDHRPQEQHRPDPERAGQEFAVTEELEELEDRLRDREIHHLLREEDRVAHFQHREREGKEGARHQVCRDEREGHP